MIDNLGGTENEYLHPRRTDGGILLNPEGRPVYSDLKTEMMGNIRAVCIEGIPITQKFREDHRLPDGLTEYDYVSLRPAEEGIDPENRDLTHVVLEDELELMLDMDGVVISPVKMFARGDSNAFLYKAFADGLRGSGSGGTGMIDLFRGYLRDLEVQKLVLISAHGWGDTISDGIQRENNPKMSELIERYSDETTGVMFLSCRAPDLDPLPPGKSIVVFQRGMNGSNYRKSGGVLSAAAIVLPSGEVVEPRNEARDAIG